MIVLLLLLFVCLFCSEQFASKGANFVIVTGPNMVSVKKFHFSSK